MTCNDGGACVLVEDLGDVVVIRDSKNPYQPGLVFSDAEYAAFRKRVKGGRFPWLIGILKVLVSLRAL